MVKLANCPEIGIEDQVTDFKIQTYFKKGLNFCQNHKRRALIFELYLLTNFPDFEENFEKYFSVRKKRKKNVLKWLRWLNAQKC